MSPDSLANLYIYGYLCALSLVIIKTKKLRSENHKNWLKNKMLTLFLHLNFFSRLSPFQIFFHDLSQNSRRAKKIRMLPLREKKSRGGGFPFFFKKPKNA